MWIIAVALLVGFIEFLNLLVYGSGPGGFPTLREAGTSRSVGV